MALALSSVDAAKERAAQFVDEHPVELWDGLRRIARFTPSDEDQAAGVLVFPERATFVLFAGFVATGPTS